MPKFRKSLRLPNYDYSQVGYYFVTMCVQDRECLLGECIAGSMRINSAGLLIEESWLELQRHYVRVVLDRHVVMPNHFHGILALNDVSETDSKKISGHGLPELIRAFKSFSARRVNNLRKTPGERVWQRGYHEHVIRNEEDYLRIAEYIESNPARWSEDSLNPDNANP
ncbi:transposase [Dokdonella sp.]|uniref:transposase n=1 Tax=Dokdonella sp. TaxID=2291710 RepID=UPI003C3D0302